MNKGNLDWELLNMPIHSTVHVEIMAAKGGPNVCWMITRVLTGWIYQDMAPNGSGVVFVPLSLPQNQVI